MSLFKSHECNSRAEIRSSDGILADPTGALIIKPCTSAETAFYQALGTEQHALLDYVPAFMGTLSLSTPEQRNALMHPDPMSINAALQAEEGTAEELPPEDRSHLHGKKLVTGDGIVLENVAYGFYKPSIMDIKLGSRLWADDAPEAKRARLDKVAGQTTSGSLGFRIAGMRVWKVDEEKYDIYDKNYGRTFTSSNVQEAFEEFFGTNKYRMSRARRTALEACAAEIEQINQVLANEEIRFYSSSLLLVVEGDEDHLRSALTELERLMEARQVPTGQQERDDEQEEEEDEDQEGVSTPRLSTVKLIDFAHASWMPGSGPDENVLTGIKSVLEILHNMVETA